MKENAEFTGGGGVGKNANRVLSRLLTKVHDVLRRCSRPLVVVKALDRFSISRFAPKMYRSLKLPLSSEVVQKIVLGPRFVGEGIPQILDMGFQIAVTSEHVADFG